MTMAVTINSYRKKQTISTMEIRNLVSPHNTNKRRDIFVEKSNKI